MLVQLATLFLGLVLILGILSILASTVMEWVDDLFKLRSQALLNGLRSILASADVNARVYKDFINHPRFRQLAPNPEKKRSQPESLPPEEFQAILYDLLGQYYGAPVQSPQALQESIHLLPDVDLKKTLLSLYAETDGNPVAFRQRVQYWYGGLLERGEELFKKRTRRFLFALGMLIAIGFNADAIAIFQALASNPDKAKEALGLVSQYQQTGTVVPQPFTPPATEAPQPSTPPGAGAPQPFTPPATEAPQPFTPPGAGAAASGGSGQTAFPELAPEAQKLTRQLLRQELSNAEAPLGLGWANMDLATMSSRAWAFKLAGWLLTALAISFGSSFWFDILRNAFHKRPRLR